MATSEPVIAELIRIYDQAVETLRNDISAFASDGTLPPPERRSDGSWCYPELRIQYAGREKRPDVMVAAARLHRRLPVD